MKIRVVGFKQVRYISKKTSKEVYGKTVFYTKPLSVNIGDGCSVGEFWLSSNNDYFHTPLIIGDEYTVYFDGRQVDYLGN